MEREDTHNRRVIGREKSGVDTIDFGKLRVRDQLHALFLIHLGGEKAYMGSIGCGVLLQGTLIISGNWESKIRFQHFWILMKALLLDCRLLTFYCVFS